MARSEESGEAADGGGFAFAPAAGGGGAPQAPSGPAAGPGAPGGQFPGGGAADRGGSAAVLDAACEEGIRTSGSSEGSACGDDAPGYGAGGCLPGLSSSSSVRARRAAAGTSAASADGSPASPGPAASGGTAACNDDTPRRRLSPRGGCVGGALGALRSLLLPFRLLGGGGGRYAPLGAPRDGSSGAGGGQAAERPAPSRARDFMRCLLVRGDEEVAQPAPSFRGASLLLGHADATLRARVAAGTRREAGPHQPPRQALRHLRDPLPSHRCAE